MKVPYTGHVDALYGNPDISKTEATYVERFNATLRKDCRRLTPQGYAHSKNWAILRCVPTLNFAHYYFCRSHRTLRTTPAVAAGLTTRPWNVVELLEATCF